MHAVVTATPTPLPVAIAIGKGSEHEGRRLIPLMKSIDIRQKGRGGGRPRKRPKVVYADTKYGMPLNKFYLSGKGIDYQIPSTEKKRKPGRPKRFDEETYHAKRSSIERFFAWMKNYRKLNVRYERLASVFLGLFRVASIMILTKVLK